MYSSDEEAVNEGQGSGIAYAVVALCLFLLSWQASFRLLDNCIGALLAFMHHFLLFFLLLYTLSHSPYLQRIYQKC